MAPKIYHLHPLVAGPLTEWPGHFAHCRDLGFDAVCLAPPFAPGDGGDIFATSEHEALHPALGSRDSADDALARAAESAAGHGLALLLDVAIDRVAANAALRCLGDWFGDADSPDPRRPCPPGLVYARFDRAEVAEHLTSWWIDRLVRLAQAGLAGFRCLEPDSVPPPVWRRLIAAVREAVPGTRFIAWTPGLDHAAIGALAGCGFDNVVRSLAWWDERAPWLIEEAASLRRVAPSLASPEPSFAERLAWRLPQGADLRAPYAHAIRVAAATASGIFVPMGFEYAARRPFDAATATPDDLHRAREEAPAGLADDVRAACALVDRMAALRVDGELRLLTEPGEPVTALLRADAPDVRYATRAAVVLINPELGASVTSQSESAAQWASIAVAPPPCVPLPPQAGAAFGGPQPLEALPDPNAPLAHGEVRVLSYTRASDVTLSAPPPMPDLAAMTASRIAIEALSPLVPGGDYAVKRVVGEAVFVTADIIPDGHDVLAAEILWRAADEAAWHHAPMRLAGNDRWEASFAPTRVGAHEFTVEAWRDLWGTFHHDLTEKHKAGLVVTLELEEGRLMIQAAAARSAGSVRAALRALLDCYTAVDEPARIALLLSDDARAAMRAADDRPFAARHRLVRLDIDRPQAVFASWYEMFPRSATDDPSRHGTFDDVVLRLPAIRAMGFDVLYFPPIHPIGATNRKGRNNSLHAQPGEPGSPYAIGGKEGGHDAIHPELGTLDSFLRLVAAAHANGLEIALDFAIQCSPDHPWLRQHKDWFSWRPDGSLRYAENPPKKYEDIVNPDFYAPASFPSLWRALRDVVLFWAEQGVRVFRVDNPHTKPIPFWQWMIADIRARYPDAIFLAEAFTRPKVMYRLAKAGFTQSYTYFTWRDTRQEMTQYLTELNQYPVREFFRPNFFVNTPDINPVFLQESGRAGFLIRAALATTLSGLWGMYSGFEICEAAPLPGREEYLDSEKFEIRVRDQTIPGNIVAEITTLNRIRRSHAALQTHLGVTFHTAFNDQVLLFGKATPARHEIILVAVSFDPHNVQEANIEVPLWEFGLPDGGTVDVTDLMRGNRFTWTGKTQRVRLDPADLPFAIWQLTVPAGAR